MADKPKAKVTFRAEMRHTSHVQTVWAIFATPLKGEESLRYVATTYPDGEHVSLDFHPSGRQVSKWQSRGMMPDIKAAIAVAKEQRASMDMTPPAAPKAQSEPRRAAAMELAELVLEMDMVSPKGQLARKLARKVLGVQDGGTCPDVCAIVTNGTVRLIPREEPLFLLRAQDPFAAGAVRAWAEKARAGGAVLMADLALGQALQMEKWPHRKVPDWPPQAA